MRKPSASKVGYGRPPTETRFRKGQSGNPTGRRKKPTKPPKRIGDILLEEALRPLRLKVGDEVIEMSTRQAMIRSLLNQAVKGNGPALRFALPLILNLDEKDAAAAAALESAQWSDEEIAKRLSFILERAAQKKIHAEHEKRLAEARSNYKKEPSENDMG